MAKQFATATEIGDQFGLSAIKIGKKLQELGLREGKIPSQKAKDEHLCMCLPSSLGDIWLWRREEVIEILEKAGLKRIAAREAFERKTEREDRAAELWAERAKNRGEWGL